MVYDRSKVFTSHVNNFFSPSWLVLATHACSTMTVHSLNPYTSWNYLLLQGTMCVFVCVWGEGVAITSFWLKFDKQKSQRGITVHLFAIRSDGVRQQKGKT